MNRLGYGVEITLIELMHYYHCYCYLFVYLFYLCSFRVEIDNFQITLNTLLGKVDAFKIKLNI